MTGTQIDISQVQSAASVREGVDIPHDCEPTADVSGAPAGPGAIGGRRLVGVDIARGLALIGMMAVHILSEVNDDGAMSAPWILAVGKAAALFAVLAGVGIAFGSGGRRRPLGRGKHAAAASLVVRALMIGAVGLLLGTVVPIESAAVILVYYAVLFLLAIPLLSLSRRALVVLAVGITVLAPALSHLVRAALPEAAVSNPSFSDLLAQPLQLLAELTLTGAFPAMPWLAYVCVGLAVGRSELRSRGVVVRIGTLGVVIALAASVGSWLAMTVAGGWRHLEAVALTTMTPTEYTDLVVWGFTGTTPTDTAWWLGVMSPHSSTTFDLGFTIGISLAVLAAALLLGRVAARVLAPLAAAGGMTLTLYAVHLLMIGSPFLPEGDVEAFVVQVVVVVGFALVWGLWSSRGPLEAAVWWATRWVREAVVRRQARSAGLPDDQVDPADTRHAAASG